MSVDDILAHLESNDSPWSFIIAVAIILAVVSGLFSKAAENYGGIFGKAKRAIEQHKRDAIRADELSNARRLDRLEETIRRLDDEICQLRRKDQLHHEYSLYVTDYWRDLEAWAVKHGVDLPPPPMLTYREWKEQNYPED